MFTKSNLVILKYLIKTGRLVLNFDGTGGLLNFPSCQHLNGKILHYFLSVNPKFALLDKTVSMERMSGQLMSPLLVAEHISNLNNGLTLHDFLKLIKDSLYRLVGAESSELPNPLLGLTDCSAAIQSAFLMTFPGTESETSSCRIVYANTISTHCRYFDTLAFRYFRTSHGVTGDRTKNSQQQDTAIRESAVIVINSMRRNCGVFLKECRAHVYRAASAWPKLKLKVGPGGVSNSDVKSRIMRIIASNFHMLTKEKFFTIVIVKWALLVALFTVKSFACPKKFDQSSPRLAHRSQTELSEEDDNHDAVVNFIYQTACEIQINTLGEVEARVFPAKKISDQYDRLWETLVMKAETFLMNNCSCYLVLESDCNADTTITGNNPLVPVSQPSTETLCLSVVYSSWHTLVTESTNNNSDNGEHQEEDKDGPDILTKDDSKSRPTMFKQGGLRVPVTIPADKGTTIPNPLHSPAVAKYLTSTWSNQVPIWSHAIIFVLEQGMNMSLPGSNQGSEGFFCNAKHHTDIRKYTGSLAEYIKFRSEEMRREASRFAKETELLDDGVKLMVKRQLKKKEGKATQNEREHLSPSLPENDLEEETLAIEQNEQWSSKRQPLTSDHLRAILNGLPKEFTSGRGSSKAMHEAILSVVGEMKGLSYHTFNSFYGGKEKELSMTNRSLLTNFVKHIGAIPGDTDDSTTVPDMLGSPVVPGKPEAAEVDGTKLGNVVTQPEADQEGDCWLTKV